MISVTKGATTIQVPNVLGFETGSEMPTVEHQLSTGDVAYTLRKALPRRGTLSVLFTSWASALAFYNLNRQIGSLTLADTIDTARGMVYVVLGTVTISPDNETGAAWTVDVPYREVI